MNKLSRLQGSLLFLLTLFATGCSRVADHNRFLKEHGIKQTDKIPVNYSEGHGWKTLAGNYVYFMDIFEEPSGSQMLYIVANKKENRMIGLMHVNPFIMPAALAKGVSPATVVTNYEEISPADITKANNMTEFNALLKAMPEMKDFKWQTTMQNQIASGIILKTHFIYATKSSVDDKLFSYSEKPVFRDHDKELQEIFSTGHILHNRGVQRLNKSVEMGQFISMLGFTFDKKDIKSMGPHPDKFYIDDLLVHDPIDFKGKGKMFFFIAFKSYVRPETKGETPAYIPAIETYEYSITPDQDGFPVFKRNTHFASLLEPVLTPINP
jgi:hypothetical protein